MKALASTQDMSREDWLSLRRQGIGGSDAAAIAGLNPWKSPIAVWMEKTGQYEPEEPGEAAYWGNALESLVAEEFARRTGKKTRRKNAILQHPEHPWMLANVDRLVVGERAGLECKTTSAYNSREWDADTGKLPDMYALQCQHYMAVTGYEWWYMAVLIGGQRFLNFAVQRDDELVEQLVRIEREFWQLVEDETPPPMDGSEASADLLNTLYPDSDGEIIYLPEEAAELIDLRDMWAEQERDAVDRRREAENKLKEMLGEHEAGIRGERRVSWKSVTRTSLDSKRLKADKPELYEEYCKESTSRRFSIK